MRILAHRRLCSRLQTDVTATKFYEGILLWRAEYDLEGEKPDDFERRQSEGRPSQSGASSSSMGAPPLLLPPQPPPQLLPLPSAQEEEGDDVVVPTIPPSDLQEITEA